MIRSVGEHADDARFAHNPSFKQKEDRFAREISLSLARDFLEEL
jgi:hypothetical protein